MGIDTGAGTGAGTGAETGAGTGTRDCARSFIFRSDYITMYGCTYMLCTYIQRIKIVFAVQEMHKRRAQYQFF